MEALSEFDFEHAMPIGQINGYSNRLGIVGVVSAYSGYVASFGEDKKVTSFTLQDASGKVVVSAYDSHAELVKDFIQQNENYAVWGCQHRLDHGKYKLTTTPKTIIKRLNRDGTSQTINFKLV